jgi:flagellar basal-body rod modification protein FlgD
MPIAQDNVVSPSLLATMNAAAGSKTSTAAATQDRFLKLLVAQMKNQDPMNPLDNAEVTSQLAQLSTVTGIDKLNATLEAMMGSTQSNQSLQAASMIGRGVLAPGSSLNLSEGRAVFGVELSAPADSGTVTIRDSAGRPIHEIALGAQAAGTVPLQWDGMTSAGVTATDGSYTIEVSAMAAGQRVSAITLGFGQVTSVSGGAQGPKLNVPGLGALSMADVRQIL